MDIYELIKNRINIVREDRKTIALIVYPDLSITLKSPLSAECHTIDKFIRKRAVWVYKQLEYFKQFQNKRIQCYISGSAVKYLGRQYMLKVERADSDYVEFTKNRFYLYTKNFSDIRYNKNILTNFLYNKAEVIFMKELENCLAGFRYIEKPSLKIRILNKRWGSFLNNTVILNPILIMADRKSIRYVITHELCHYFHREHSPDFYALLESKIPDWRDIKHKMELKILTYE